MKKIVYNLLGLIALMSISCTSDPLLDGGLEAIPNAEVSEQQIETFEIKVSYKGITYDVPCEYVNDSLNYLNEEFKDLFLNEISNSNELIAFYDPETEVIEYFTSNEDFVKSGNLNIDSICKNQDAILIAEPEETRYHEHIVGDALNNYAEAILFDDTNYEDSRLLICCFEKDGSGNYYAIGIPNFSSFGMNDKASSLRVHCTKYSGSKSAILICYENSNYNESNQSKAVLFCKAPVGKEYTAPSLKKIPAHGKDSWNDRISSCILLIDNPNLYPDGTV